MDFKFWERYAHEIRRAGFRGERVTICDIDGIERISPKAITNSGAGAIVLAAMRGARRVVLLGYDGQRTGGRAHWHDDYPRGMGNAGAADKWPGQFEALATYLAPSGVEIVNASRESAVTAFPRVDLKEALAWHTFP